MKTEAHSNSDLVVPFIKNVKLVLLQRRMT